MIGEVHGMATGQTTDGTVKQHKQQTLTDMWIQTPQRDAGTDMVCASNGATSNTANDNDPELPRHSTQDHHNEQDNEDHANDSEESKDQDIDYDSLVSDQEMASVAVPNKKKKKRIKKGATWKPQRLHEHEMSNGNQLNPDGYYIGDEGTAPNNTKSTMRIATTNINKHTWTKIDQEVADWFRANHLDALILSDTDLPNEET